MEFKLSAELSGHDEDVRAVAFPNPETVISASRDKSVRVWHKTSKKPPAFEAVITTQGQEWLSCLSFLPPSSEYPDGLIIVGGKDTIIEVKKLRSTHTDNAERLLVGHSSNICALDVSPKGSYIVSGSWDSLAIVWRVGKWGPELRLLGHSASVWGVLALDESTVVTGSADKKVHVYDLRRASDGQAHPSHVIHTPDVVRAVCRVPAGHGSGASIATAHNDGVIRLWTLSGRPAGELHGHESFVYSLVSLPSGELVSSGEDRTIRIWKGLECVQTITLPAISVWSVATCGENGDIVSGSSDGVVRIFTRNSENLADAEALRHFEESVKASSIPQQQVGGINKEALPGPDFLKARSGTKEGQIQMIKEDDGSVTAHQWSMGQQQWINVGTVVDAVGSSGKKVEYNGQSYDYVFDVDIKEGAPPLKLPYNLSQNPWDAATKFLGENELPLAYLDNVANFIVENIKGATIGQSSQQTATAPTSQPEPVPKILPQGSYLTLAVANFGPVKNKILSVNNAMLESGRKHFALNPDDVQRLDKLFGQLMSTVPRVPSAMPATTTATLSDPLLVSGTELELVLKIATKWPDTDRLPGLDLLRCMAISPSVAGFDDASRGSVIDMALDAAVGEGGRVSENCVMMAFRLIANMFVTEQGRRTAHAKIGKVIEFVEGVLGTGSGPIGQVNPGKRNVLIAVTTATINYAVLGYTAQKHAAASKNGDLAIGPEDLAIMGNALGKLLKDQADSEVSYRALAALGTMAAAGDEYVASLKSLGVEEAVGAASQKATEQRVKDIAGECLHLMR